MAYNDGVYAISEALCKLVGIDVAEHRVVGVEFRQRVGEIAELDITHAVFNVADGELVDVVNHYDVTITPRDEEGGSVVEAVA